MALAPLLYNITFDSQTRILYFWDKAGHEIYHCEIPSPAPALPTVTKISYYYNHNHYEGSVSAGATKDIYTWEGGGVPYDDTTKKQCVYGWRNAQLTAQGYGCFETVDYQDWGIVGAKNITSSTITQIYIFRYAECNSPDATVITVYDSSNNPYNAFKYTANGTDYYYYVLDGIQTDWTDDLSSIGYHVPPSLPTVSMSGFIMPGHVVTINAGSTSTGWYVGSTGQPFVYESTKSYGVRRALDAIGGNDIDPTVFALVDSSGELAVKNISNSSVNVEVIYVSVCSSSLATVITVYDSSNNPYNAFKYTSDGTDYYYVLDGTQTDWTDDLSGIGYHLPAQTLELVVWVSDSDQAQLFGANDYWYSRIGSESDVQALIDFGGEVITDGQYKYIKVLNTFFYDLVDIYGATGNPIPSADFNNFWLAKGNNNHSGSLYIRSIQAYSTGIKTWKVRITENKDNVSWMMSDQSDVLIGYAGSHQLYDSSGNTIPYDSTKTYTIVGYYTVAIYVSLDDLTTSNNQHFSFINYNSSGYLGIKSSDNSTDYRIQRVIYKVE